MNELLLLLGGVVGIGLGGGLLLLLSVSSPKRNLFPHETWEDS